LHCTRIDIATTSRRLPLSEARSWRVTTHDPGHAHACCCAAGAAVLGAAWGRCIRGCVIHDAQPGANTRDQAAPGPAHARGSRACACVCVLCVCVCVLRAWAVAGTGGSAHTHTHTHTHMNTNAHTHADAHSWLRRQVTRSCADTHTRHDTHTGPVLCVCNTDGGTRRRVNE
jgi:hypothetical protein